MGACVKAEVTLLEIKPTTRYTEDTTGNEVVDSKERGRERGGIKTGD